MDEFLSVGTSIESNSKSVNLDGARKMALKHIDSFVLSFSDPQAFATAAVSSAPAALAQVTERARIHEAGHLRCRYSFRNRTNITFWSQILFGSSNFRLSISCASQWC